MQADGRVLDELTALLGAAADPAASSTAVLTVDGAGTHRAGGERVGGEAVATCLQVMNAVALEQCRSFAVHAGVVSRDGVGVAFPAVSGAGKSTLVAACLLAGLDYVSDEALVLADDLTVRAYARPLTLSRWSLSALGVEHLATGPETPVSPMALGVLAKGDVRVEHLVLLTRGPGPSARATGRAGTATEVLRRSFNHHAQRERALRLAAGTARDSQCWSLTYDGPTEAAAWISSLLA